MLLNRQRGRLQLHVDLLRGAEATPHRREDTSPFSSTFRHTLRDTSRAGQAVAQSSALASQIPALAAQSTIVSSLLRFAAYASCAAHRVSTASSPVTGSTHLPGVPDPVQLLDIETLVVLELLLARIRVARDADRAADCKWSRGSQRRRLQRDGGADAPTDTMGWRYGKRPNE